MSQNTNLADARRDQKDEFYTQRTDIEDEMKHYKKHFHGKVIYCNCDDPRISNFFRYFSYGFEHLELKKLVTTCYKSQDMNLFSQNKFERSISLEYNGDKKGNMMPDPKEIGINQLKGDGDFRSQECIDLLKQADIVSTNPPFSLFREYVAQLMEHDKKFIILGNMNAITYKEIFKLVKENKIWLGINNGPKTYEVPQYYIKDNITIGDDGKKYAKMGNTGWFTNLDFPKRHADLIIYKTYKDNESDYPKYDNYNIINVNRISDIPADYDGVMGVPITFLDKYNPDQFKILGIANSARWIGHECYTLIKGRKIYNRILIKNLRI